ncbi:type II toxin-antitoxin system RelE family toxin [Enterobacter roggenkampii]|jgi:mRNA-degrading endonuclease RelE of RelBE toxin-antitoxin system|uniref:type II toxin-antitoxin system RelE family toxin n=1 Tax=Enterobacter roggenkampii TaxID=1812935 RepID=UPI000FD8737B|nr:hypothetical protein [Enterobacter roggenkampii]EHF8251991.1 hypothetical protein [Enterobacter roggenkampii]MBA7742633.1 hypothetical protein [Enterobacter roggenkampii]MBT2027775.1 hypothetical protein [Enterobacter roggenkampii]MBT2032238.1 hypothetical protein [Enterobacter roggenkampii]MCM7636192.1 hypothetical protein [Enterobacter roggenkampii]
MLNTIVTTPRFERKIDLLDNRLSHLFIEKLKKLETDNLSSIFEQSEKLNGFSETHLWITRISNDYRLIFRIADKNEIELIDIVSRHVLSKFGKERK